MSETYAKLFSSILRSSIWAEPMETRLVWITMLALADRHGYVGASLPGIATAAGVTMEKAQTAIDTFLAPDPYSRSKEFDGRRIEVADRGWILLNYERFRDMRDEEARKEYERTRKRASRAAKRSVDVPDSQGTSRDTAGQDGTVPECPAMSAHSSAEASASEEGRKEEPAAPTPETEQQKAINLALVELGIYDISAPKRLRLVRKLDTAEVTADRIREMWAGLCDRYPKDHDRAAGMLARMLTGKAPLSGWQTLKFNSRKPRKR